MVVVDLRVLLHELTIDDVLPRVDRPGKAARHAPECQRHIDEHLLPAVLGALEVLAADPADPTCGVEEHQSGVYDVAADNLACGNRTRQAIPLAAITVTVGLLAALRVGDLRVVALPDHSVLGILLLAHPDLVDLVLKLLVELLVVLAFVEIPRVVDGPLAEVAAPC